MLKLILNVYRKILNKKQKFQTKLFVFLNIMFAIFELISVAAIIPIIFLISDSNLKSLNFNLPEFVSTRVNDMLISENSYLYISGIILTFFSIKFIFSIYLNLFNIRFNSFLIASLRSQLFNIFIKKNYTQIIKYNSSQITNILTKISEVTISNFFISFLLVFRSLFIIIPLIIFLFFINLKLTLILLVISILVLSIYFLIFKKLIINLGKKELIYHETLLGMIKEFFNGYSMLKLYNLESKYLYIFKEKAFNYARVKIIFRFINQFPKLSFEITVLIFIFLQILILKYFNYNNDYIISFIGVFVLVSFKLVPQIIYVFSLFNKIRQSQVATKVFLDEYLKIGDKISIKSENIDFRRGIELESVSFKHENSDFLFENINLQINFGEKVGILGKSGAGKTSLVNMMCGFLKPHSGKILIDGNELKRENYLSWQKKISLVEQNVYLFNDTIKNNIVLNGANERIDHERLDESIKKAQLTELINKVSNGLETIINQNSSNISGGERQRIGIARAFYRNSKLIILDEPTSSLDEENSNKILKLLQNINDKTIIIISHEQDVLKICNSNYSLKNKKINKIF